MGLEGVGAGGGGWGLGPGRSFFFFFPNRVDFNDDKARVRKAARPARAWKHKQIWLGWDRAARAIFCS